VVRAWEYDSSILSGRTTKVEVILSGRTRDEALTAEIARVAADKYPDVALLRINSPGLRTIRGVADNIEEINRGDDVAAIGYPLGLDLLALTSDTRIEPSLTTGIVSRVGHDAIQLSLRANHGNSGGPAINRRGEVIGIVTSNVGAAPDITLCTPISAALELTKH
jgi:serine protease Do